MRITQALNNQSLGAEALAEHDNASAAGQFEAGQGRSKKGREAKFGKSKPQSTMGKTLSLPFVSGISTPLTPDLVPCLLPFRECMTTLL
jgi:hypothetical protein